MPKHGQHLEGHHGQHIAKASLPKLTKSMMVTNSKRAEGALKEAFGDAANQTARFVRNSQAQNRGPHAHPSGQLAFNNRHHSQGLPG